MQDTDNDIEMFWWGLIPELNPTGIPQHCSTVYPTNFMHPWPLQVPADDPHFLVQVV